MELIDLHHQKTHGGSMRYVLQKGAYNPSPRVFDTLKEERKLGLDNLDKFIEFSDKVKKSKTDLKKLYKILSLKKLLLICSYLKKYYSFKLLRYWN